MEVLVCKLEGQKKMWKLDELIHKAVERLDKNKRVGSHVIQRKGLDKQVLIKTTVLYFDIDKFDGDINNHITKLSRFLEKYYDNLYLLILKSKGFDKYHLYFPNIFVSKATLSTLVKLFNEECNVLDESCINNLLRLEGSTKYNPKTKKYVKDSQYKLINQKLSNKELYNKIYRFNKEETISKVPIITQEKKSKPIPKSPLPKSPKSNISSKLNDLLCEEFGDFKWDFETESETSIKLLNNAKSCLVDSSHSHSSINHSCIFINKHGKSYACCLSHGKLQIPLSSNLQQIKQLLGLTSNKQENDNKDLNDFEILCKDILEDGEKHKYRKFNGYIYEPQPYSPIVFKRTLIYRDYLNKLFSDKSKVTSRIFRKKVTHLDSLEKYMSSYNDIEFPFLITNKHIFSFLNGYLDISDLFNIKFVEYKSLDNDNNIATTIHFDIEFDIEWLQGNSLETPIFDTIVNNHLSEFENENDNMLYDIFCGMLGRLHYNIGQFDSFNCMLFLKGFANTGKSTIGDFVLSNHQNKGIIAGNEENFPLMSCYQSQLAYNTDIKRNFHEKFDKALLQKCIEGATVDVAIKHGEAINDHKWIAPIFIISNYFLGYIDDSNAIPRRSCIFTFDNFITNRDASLPKKMYNTERHLFLIKSLLKYRQLVDKYQNKTFQDWNLKYFNDNTLKIQSKTDYVYDFCNLAPGDFKYWPVYEKDSIITVPEFKKLIERYVYLTHSQKYRYTWNKHALKALGFESKPIKVCAECGEKPNRSTCCPKSNNRNRRNKYIIRHMKILELDHRKRIVTKLQKPKNECEISDTDSD